MEQQAAQRVLRVLLGDLHLQFVILRLIQSAMSVHCTRSNQTRRFQHPLARLVRLDPTRLVLVKQGAFACLDITNLLADR